MAKEADKTLSGKEIRMQQQIKEAELLKGSFFLFTKSGGQDELRKSLNEVVISEIKREYNRIRCITEGTQGDEKTENFTDFEKRYLGMGAPEILGEPEGLAEYKDYLLRNIINYKQS